MQSFRVGGGNHFVVCRLDHQHSSRGQSGAVGDRIDFGDQLREFVARATLRNPRLTEFRRLGVVDVPDEFGEVPPAQDDPHLPERVSTPPASDDMIPPSEIPVIPSRLGSISGRSASQSAARRMSRTACVIPSTVSTGFFEIIRLRWAGSRRGP